MKSRLRPAIAGLVLALGLVGCSSSTDTTPSAAETTASGPVVTISGMAYSPASITVSVGDTVTWVFDDNGMAHDVSGLGDAKGKLRSPLKKSGTYTYTFTEPGTYDYTCTPHPEMRGTVVVQAQ
ncbi:cupredoxin family copper-binding protein [Rhodococcus erythropolis]|uniref:cupredoxin domain-containing protein n=1 Tax=Rhodococcus erythropolis TaxID=1833 RepID=UPI001E408F85|nr:MULTISPECIES: cupredoxin family copper-binding protein [Rhodococcus erythropolis group]MCD2103695.1 cupredoxin family copper-binding protein [Rhodococcus qingshengii]MCZ4522745.1 cupredoxin family copper-binding protein [Rhodococcus erythropolis]